MIGKQVLAFGKSKKSEFIYIGSFVLSGVTRIWGPNIGRSRRYRVWSHVCKYMEFFSSATRWSIPTCHKMRSFVCKHFHPNWFWVVFQFFDWHMRNVLMDEQHDPATMDISVFSIYTVWACFRKEFWSCNRTVDFGFLDSYNMWLMKVKECRQFQFFASERK